MPDRDTAVLLLMVGGLLAVFAPLNRWLVRRARRGYDSAGPAETGGGEAPPAGSRSPGEAPPVAREPEPPPAAVAPEAKPLREAEPPEQPETPWVSPVGPVFADRTTASLKEALGDPDPFVRVAAVAGLVGRPGVEDILLEALRDDFPQVRREAVRALRQIGGPRAAHAFSEVVQGDPSAEVREEAVIALAAFIERRVAGERDGA